MCPLPKALLYVRSPKRTILCTPSWKNYLCALSQKHYFIALSEKNYFMCPLVKELFMCPLPKEIFYVRPRERTIYVPSPKSTILCALYQNNYFMFPYPKTPFSLCKHNRILLKVTQTASRFLQAAKPCSNILYLSSLHWTLHMARPVTRAETGRIASNWRNANYSGQEFHREGIH